MDSIIGLIHAEEAVGPAVEKLKAAGIMEQQISLISEPERINKLVGCDPICAIRKYALWGAALGVAVYGIYGVIAAVCQCGLMHMGLEFGIAAFIGAILAGTFVGGVLGAFVGAGEAEENANLYLQGVRLGGRLISIQVAKADAELVKQILVTENVSGVKALRLEGA